MILIDSSVGSKDLIRYPPLNDPSIGKLCKLDSADVCFRGVGPSGAILCGVEVKTISDLVSSRFNGRSPGRQVPDMFTVGDYDDRWLLLYGGYRCGDDNSLQMLVKRSDKGAVKALSKYAPDHYWSTYKIGNNPMPYSYLTSFLVSLADIGIHYHHIPYNREQGLQQCAKWIAMLYGKRQKLWEGRKEFRCLDQSRELLPGLSGNKKVMAEMAAALPGIGYDRAEAVANYFSSPRDMIAADASEWSEIKVGTKRGKGRVVRIGTVIAEEVQRTLDGERGRR